MFLYGYYPTDRLLYPWSYICFFRERIFLCCAMTHELCLTVSHNDNRFIFFVFRSLKSSAAGVVLCAWVSLLKIRLESTLTACPNTPALTWYPRVDSGLRPYQKSLQMRETSFPSGWIRRGEYFTASMIPVPCCSSVAFGPRSHCGPSLMSTVWPEECNYWVSKITICID